MITTHTKHENASVSENDGRAVTFNGRACRFNASHRKERGGFREEIAALSPSPYSETELRAVVVLRIYSTGQRRYACVWVNGESHHLTGSGVAREAREAMQKAFNNAGIEIPDDGQGSCDNSMRDAVLNVAKSAGFPNAKIHRAHA